LGPPRLPVSTWPTSDASLGAYIDDGAIELKIRQYLLRNKAVRQQAHLSATSMNGVVLLTGEARDPGVKKQVLDYIQGIEGVRQVVDESQIAGRTGLISRTNDSWLTTKVKTTLFAKTGFDANRVKVVTEHGTVYLMGLLTQAEASQAVDVVRGIDGVVRVVKVFEYVD
jgi:osmotically-inducible protein OsmY